MKKSGKVWGVTTEIIKTSNFEVHRIEILKDGYCSIHKHKFKNNMFFVETGSIRVDVYKGDYELIDDDLNLVDKTILNEGETLIVKPNEYHKFYGLKESIVYEIYWLDDISEDIVRKTSGGIYERKHIVE